METEYLTKELMIKECKELGIWKKWAKFVVYSEGAATYELVKDDMMYYEISVISNNDRCFFRKEKVKDLIGWKEPFFVDVNIYLNTSKERVRSICYRLIDDPKYIEEEKQVENN